MKKSILTIVGTLFLCGMFGAALAANTFCPHTIKIPGVTNKPEVFIQCYDISETGPATSCSQDCGLHICPVVFAWTKVCGCKLAGKDMKTTTYELTYLGKEDACGANFQPYVITSYPTP